MTTEGAARRPRWRAHAALADGGARRCRSTSLPTRLERKEAAADPRGPPGGASRRRAPPRQRAARPARGPCGPRAGRPGSRPVTCCSYGSSRSGTEHEPWRDAFNLALGGFATVLLLDAAHLRAFRAAIDTVPTGRRVQFQGVLTGGPDDVALDSGTLPGRLDFVPAPSRRGCAAKLAQRFDYVCVATPGEPRAAREGADPDRAGVAGHARRARRAGARQRARIHQHAGSRSSTSRSRARSSASTSRPRASPRRSRASTRATRSAEPSSRSSPSRGSRSTSRPSRRRVPAGQVVEEVSRGEPADRRPAASSRRTRYTTITALTGLLGRTKADAQALGEQWSATTDEVDAAQRALDEATAAGTTVGPAQRARRGVGRRSRGSSAPGTTRSARCGPSTRCSPGRTRCSWPIARPRSSASARDALRRTFETFVERWPDPNLGTDLDVARATSRVSSSSPRRMGCIDLEAEQAGAACCGCPATTRTTALARSVREIKERIRPVNDIRDLAVADDDRRLRIDARDTQSTVVARFREPARSARGAATDATDAERERRTCGWRRVVDRIRRTAPDFADLVDVRQHVRLSAEKVDLDGRHVALYDHIGEKSGGESQGFSSRLSSAPRATSARRRGRRAAPVRARVPRRGLIKADARFTGRAIGARRGSVPARSARPTTSSARSSRTSTSRTSRPRRVRAVADRLLGASPRARRPP